MSEQLLARLTKQNRSREKYSPIRRNTSKQGNTSNGRFFFSSSSPPPPPPPPCVSSYRRVHFPRSVPLHGHLQTDRVTDRYIQTELDLPKANRYFSKYFSRRLLPIGPTVSPHKAQDLVWYAVAMGKYSARHRPPSDH